MGVVAAGRDPQARPRLGPSVVPEQGLAQCGQVARAVQETDTVRL